MFFVDVVNQGAIPAMEKMLAFTQARQRMLAENVANADTPFYATKQLDTRAFQEALREALEDRQRGGSGEFRIRGSDQFQQDESGRLVVTPTSEPAENLLFHDQTNASIERQMAMVAENGMTHQTIAELLNNQFQGILAAIRERVA